MPAIIRQLSEVVRRKGLVIIYNKGRPCEIRKEKLITFILVSRLNRKGYELMEMESEIYLKRHYDHSAFQYHYSNLSENAIYALTELFRDKIYGLINEIYLHIFDSTALSTSVRAERTRQGIRKKEKLTDKFHTLLGYDPPFQIIVVEGMIMTDHHTSDGKGGEILLQQRKIKGYGFGDSKYGTYGLIQLSEEQNLIPIFKQDKRRVKKTLSAKARHKKTWNGNPQRMYKDIRGTGEVLYGAATRAGLIHTNSRTDENRRKDGLLIGLRQNLFTYLRLKVFEGIIRKTPSYRKVFVLELRKHIIAVLCLPVHVPKVDANFVVVVFQFNCLFHFRCSAQRKLTLNERELSVPKFRCTLFHYHKW